MGIGDGFFREYNRAASGWHYQARVLCAGGCADGQSANAVSHETLESRLQAFFRAG